jgi:histidinol phosphatase-like PHP family hydrolase
MVLLAGGAMAYKLTKKDADQIEQHTGTSVEELSEEELVAAMKELGIQSIELTEDDEALITEESAGQPLEAAGAEPEEDYLAELEKLAELRDKGILTDEEFEAKKKQLLGL